jgi:hypothetical protein
VEPIRRIPAYGQQDIAAVTRVADTAVRRETPEEAAERRRREQRERARKQAARAWADAQLRAVQQQQQSEGIVSEEDSDDGNPHVDIRV